MEKAFPSTVYRHHLLIRPAPHASNLPQLVESGVGKRERKGKREN